MKKESCFTHLLRCLHKPYCCFCKHVKTYKRTYILGLFGSFAVVKLIFLLAGLFGGLYHTPYHASAATPPSHIDPVFCYDNAPIIGIPEDECVGLVGIYNDTNGQDWTHTTARGDAVNICNNRYGVTCAAGHVTELDLSENNLVGNITSNFQDLSYLISANFSHNTISQITPIIGTNLTQLLSFDASHNNIGDTLGFFSLYKLDKIEVIDLSHNNMTEIPKNYGLLADTLRYLDLSYNKIRYIEPITDQVSNKLVWLYLSHNRIDRIPDPLLKLETLQYLDLGKNLIRDINPIGAGHLGWTLKHINLSHNLISDIPSPFNNFTLGGSLRSLDLSYNLLGKFKYIPDISSLRLLNLANNQIPYMIPLGHLTNLQELDYGFNNLTKFPIDELLKVKTTLTKLSLRHNNIEGEIPKELTGLTLLQNGVNQMDYNRLYQHKVTDPQLLTFLNQKFVQTSHQAKYFNTHRRDQYRFIDIELNSNLNTVGDIYPGSNIQITINYKNIGDLDSHDLDLSLYNLPGIYTIENLTNGYAMIKERNFDDNDPCKKDLRDNTAGVYFNILNNRALSNGISSFLTYLTSDIRDYDLYAVRSDDPNNINIVDPYTSSRGENFVKRIEKYYKYDAFLQDFQKGFFTRLFDIDLNDLAILGCGIDGKEVTSFDEPALSGNANRNKIFTLTIDPNYVGTFDLVSLIESDNRLYIERDMGNNTRQLSITVKELPTDTDADGIYDEEDNCPLVYNTEQENMDAVSFTKLNGTDRTLPENQDRITDNVRITRQNNKGIYNIVTETVFDDNNYTSPVDTERAYGTCADKDTLTFDTRNNMHGGNPPSMVDKNICLYLITDNKYYDVIFTSWASGGGGGSGGFSYTRTEYRDGYTAALGDACDCTDTICTTGNDYTGNLICSPSDSACPVPVPIADTCTFYNMYMQNNRSNTIAMFDTLRNSNVGFEITNFPYLWYFTAISYMTGGSNPNVAIQYMNMILDRQNLPGVSNENEFRATVEDINHFMTIGTISGMTLLQGTMYNQGMNNICNVAICGNGHIEGNEQCDGANLNNQTCGTLGYSQGSLSCSASCTLINTCSNPSGGGGGGGGSNPTDYCPNGDFSPSYYDHICGTTPTVPTTPPQIPPHGAAEQPANTSTKPPVSTPITRLQLAQMVVPFALEVLDIQRDTSKKCVYTDIQNFSSDAINILALSCELGLMGVEPDGYSPKPIYKPLNIVSFYEFVTVYSRLLYDGRYNIPLSSPKTWYADHLAILKKNGLVSTPVIITDSYVQSMLTKVENNLDLVQRPDANISHEAATNEQGITSPSATIISDLLKSFLNTLQKLFIQRK